MAQYDVQIVSAYLGDFSGATEIPLIHVPSEGGGVTVLEAWLSGQGVGTAVGGLIVTFSNVATGGTPVLNGTVGSFAGTIVQAAGVVHKATISAGYVEDPYWIGYDQTSGTLIAGSKLSIAYVMGR